MSTVSTNYHSDYFCVTKLTKIHSRPTYNDIKVLHHQLKANATSIFSHLGGGTNGHLGLVLSATNYAFISNTPFNCPQPPDPLHIPPNTTRDEADRITKAYDRALQDYLQVEAVESALCQQITEAIDKKYLDFMTN